MKKYIISDLIMENAKTDSIREHALRDDKVYHEYEKDGVRVCRINVNSSDEEREFSCRRGRHVTVYKSRLWELDKHERECVSKTVAKELRRIVEVNTGSPIFSGVSVLVAGLGNRRIASDAVGALTVQKLSVTRHISLISPQSFEAMGACSVCAFACGVMGETGMESAELIRGAVATVRPDIVIAIDALAAKEFASLASAVQISDSGISPGAGIGNRRGAVTKETVGVPVIAVGVPTVVSASTLISDALSRAGVTRPDTRLSAVLEEGRGFFVSPKECDLISTGAAELLALAIDKAFVGI